MIKNIFFDFGRTLVEHPEDGAGLRIIGSVGVTDPMDAALIQNSVFSVSGIINYLDEGSITREEYKNRIAAALPERLRPFALSAADYHISALPPICGMKELVRSLKDRGYKVFITSNLDAYHTEQMYGTEYAAIFDGMIFSSQIGVRKPSEEFFRLACRRFDTDPSECLFIDDLPENVQGAHEFGIEGLVFRGDPAAADAFIRSYE